MIEFLSKFLLIVGGALFGFGIMQFIYAIYKTISPTLWKWWANVVKVLSNDSHVVKGLLLIMASAMVITLASILGTYVGRYS